MKIDVTAGEVEIRNVLVREHRIDRSGKHFFSVVISTPLNKHCIVELATSILPDAGLGYVIYLHQPATSPAARNPTRIELRPEHGYERLALAAGLFEIDWERWTVTLIALSPPLMADNFTVAAWEHREPGSADYLTPPDDPRGWGISGP